MNVCSIGTGKVHILLLLHVQSARKIVSVDKGSSYISQGQLRDWYDIVPWFWEFDTTFSGDLVFQDLLGHKGGRVRIGFIGDKDWEPDYFHLRLSVH